MIKIEIPCDSGKVSDGYHTFDELYEHRHMLFLNLMDHHESWYSRFHFDGSTMLGWFIAGIELPGGKTITYHLPDKHLDLAARVATTYLDKSPPWDGHTSNDVLQRLEDQIKKS